MEAFSLGIYSDVREPPAVTKHIDTSYLDVKQCAKVSDRLHR